MSNLVDRSNFKLNKVKLIKNGGLDIHYVAITTDEDGSVSEERTHTEKTATPLTSLTDCFRAAQEYVASVYNIDFMRQVVSQDKVPFEREHAELVETTYKLNILENLHVYGFTKSGRKKNVGCVISAKFKSPAGYVMAMNTHNIKFNSSAYGFEQELEELWAKLEHEVYNYVILNKYSTENVMWDGEGNPNDEIFPPEE